MGPYVLSLDQVLCMVLLKKLKPVIVGADYMKKI